ncbi:unnamed protein product [Agarophyton chilense]|eukprot:gb/GEZJ01004527.1/.p1 GENE.gb/GEZJ01004527.1/~~gb/GEZJ01004527.1/.p1  ORF type:complete len:354 (-),score=69.71 gb/GEZJ01004527.1/:576-1637(-)
MVDTAIAPNYDSIIDRQHKKIVQLEADLARCTSHIRKLKTRTHDSSAVYAAHDLARLHAAHMHAMLAMSPALHPIPSPHPLQVAAAAAAANMPLLPGVQAQPPGASPHFAGTHVLGRARAATAAAAADEEDKAGKTRYWTAKEHQQFLYAVKLFGAKNYVAISQFVGSRTPKQVRTHAQKYQMKLEREAKKRRNHVLATAAAAAAPSASASENEPHIKEHMHPAEDAAQSESTCPMDDTMVKEEPINCLQDYACSPISNDGDDCINEDVSVMNINDRLMSNTAPAPVSSACGGMKKNSSLTNLADYDDFMRRITNVAEHDRSEMFEARDADLDVDILNATQKNQFDDSLLADL